MGRSRSSGRRIFLRPGKRSGMGFSDTADYWPLTVAPSTSRPKRSTPWVALIGAAVVFGAALALALRSGIPAW